MGKWYSGEPGYGWYAPGPGDPLPESSDEQEAPSGTRIRFFWDYGASMSLWSEQGLLPEDPEWLERELGLSPSLVADILAWGNAQEERTAGQRSTAASKEDAQEEHRLFLRIKDELHDGLTLEEGPGRL